MKNKKIILIIIFFILIFTNNCTFASFADYTDEDAERDTQMLIEEHKKEFDSSKSDNNYLKDLTVVGGKISPNFDRQTIEYSVEVNNNINEIEITATTEDNKATIKGTGKVNIKDVSECKIEVQAESGTTRTYFVKIKKQNEDSNKDNNNNNNNEINTTKNELPENKIEIVNENNNIIEEREKANIKHNNKYIIIGIGIVALLIIVLLLINQKSKKE